MKYDLFFSFPFSRGGGGGLLNTSVREAWEQARTLESVRKRWKMIGIVKQFLRIALKIVHASSKT